MRRETFTTATPPRLRIQLSAGTIDVVTTEGDETVVELEPRSGDEASQAAVEGAQIELSDRHGRPELLVKVDDQSRGGLLGLFRNGADVRLAVQAPHGAELFADTASADLRASGELAAAEVDAAAGDIRVEEVAGDLEVNTASGDVQADRVGGDAKVNSASGDVRLRDVAGRAEVRTASGDVEIGVAGRAVKIRTASGDQQVGAVTEGEVSLQSASGDIRVGVRKGSRVWVDAGSASGETTSELDLDAAPADEDGPLVELRATTMSGDVTVVRAP